MSDVIGERPTDFVQAARLLAEVKGVVPTLDAVVATVVSMLGCEWAVVAATDHLGEKPARFTASNDDDITARVAAAAGAAGDSPGIRAFKEGRVVVVHDLAHDDRFPQYARELTDRTPVRSVLSVPLRMRDTTLGVLSCYSTRPGTFTEQVMEDARALAVLAVVAIEAARDEVRADQLKMALLTARTIGAAIGILMERYKLPGEDAWELLRRASQNLNRPLAALAAELAETGTVDGLPVHEG